MSKIVAIGDIHGRNLWEKILEKEKDADRFVFIGDYFDSFSIPAAQQIENFRKIVDFKRKYPDSVVLLIGNHDFHYMPEADTDRYSGYNDYYAREIWLNLQTIREEMKLVHVEDGYLFSHAGVTKTWLDEKCGDVDLINELTLDTFRFENRDTSGYGDSIYQSPIWVRPNALVKDAVLEYVQVVGHTKQSNVAYYNGEHPAKVILIDNHDTNSEYLVVEDKTPRTESV